MGHVPLGARALFAIGFIVLAGSALAFPACSSVPAAIAVPADSAAMEASEGSSAESGSAAVDASARAPDSATADGLGADGGSETAVLQDDASTILDASDDNSALCAPMNFADCGVFIDLTGDAADRTILFGNFQYTPKCAQLKSGQSITFAGDFVVHPLVQACGPEDVLERRLPLTAAAGVDASYSFTLRAAGIYGYYCLDHGNSKGDVMSGAIQVIP